MIVEDRGRRYASLIDHERGNAMGPRELVEDAIRRQTEGSLTFRVEEDENTVAAAFELDGRQYVHGWSKFALVDDCWAADVGLRALLAKANGAGRD